MNKLNIYEMKLAELEPGKEKDQEIEVKRKEINTKSKALDSLKLAVNEEDLLGALELLSDNLRSRQELENNLGAELEKMANIKKAFKEIKSAYSSKFTEAVKNIGKGLTIRSIPKKEDRKPS